MTDLQPDGRLILTTGVTNVGRRVIMRMTVIVTVVGGGAGTYVTGVVGWLVG